MHEIADPSAIEAWDDLPHHHMLATNGSYLSDPYAERLLDDFLFELVNRGLDALHIFYNSPIALEIGEVAAVGEHVLAVDFEIKARLDFQIGDFTGTE